MILEKDINGRSLAEAVERLYRSPRTAIGEMEGKSAKLGNIRAAADIVSECIYLGRRLKVEGV